MIAVNMKGKKQMPRFIHRILDGFSGEHRRSRQYQSGYGKGLGRSMPAILISPVFSNEVDRISTTWGMKNAINHKNELQELKEQVRTFEARLHYLKKRITGIESGSIPPVIIASVDPDICVGCRVCQDVCPVGAISVGEIARVDPKRCNACGSCVQQCPRNALSLHPFI